MCNDRADVDDITTPVAKVLHCFLSGVENPQHVGVEQIAIMLLSHILQRHKAVYTSVVDQNVRRPENIRGLAEQLLNLCAVANVGFDGDSLATLSVDVVH